jgi:hypothetical protein
VGSIARLTRAWRVLEFDQRIAAGGALALLVSMFLPWYQKSFFVQVNGSLQAAKDSVSAFGAFSFVEAAVLLVAAALCFLLYARAERRAFHLPFGDGPIIAAGGAWVALLIVIRFFDKPSVDAPGRAAATVGIQWGAFVALAAAGAIFYAGSRIRMANRPEPELHGWAEEPVAFEFDPSPDTVRLPPDPPTERIASSSALTERLKRKPIGGLPDLDAPPEFGAEAEQPAEAEPAPDPDPPTPAAPAARKPRAPRAPRPSAPDEADRLF